MEDMSYILFICVTAPILSLLFIAKKEMRRGVIFLLIGMFVCLLVSEINGLLNNLLSVDFFYLTTSVTPIAEELLKSIPVFVFALLISEKLEDMLPIAFFVGIGFAIMENLILLTQNFGEVTLFWSLIRGFSSGLMHGICTGMVGICVSFIRKKKKLFYCGILAAFDLAIVYHAIFNATVQANQIWLNYVGFALPVMTYISILVFLRKNQKQTEPAK